MKVRNKDYDYCQTKKISKSWLDGSNYNYVYESYFKVGYIDGDGVTQYRVEACDTFECMDNGLIKCLRCYTLTIPFVDDDGRLYLYNLDTGESHYKQLKRTNNFFQKYKKRNKKQWVCNI